MNDAFPDSVNYPGPAADAGTSFLDSVRTEVTNNQFGPLDPEFGFLFDGTHDSQFTRLDAFDASEADIREGQGNIYSGIHAVSSPLNGGSVSPQKINWSAITAPLQLAGVANYGLESSKNGIVSNFQCDTVWVACIYLGESDSPAGDTPAVVTNVAQKCAGAFNNVWPTYYGVLLAPGTAGTAVSNVTAKPNACGITNSQLVSYQSSVNINNGNVDPSVQAVSQNLSAQFCSPSLGYRKNRYYTAPFTAASNLTIAANTLYAIPVQISCIVTVSELSVHVNGAASASYEFGIYGNNGSGQPGALIYDAGSVTLPTTGGGPARILLTIPQELGPGLVFLVAGCNGAPTLTAGTLIDGLVGLTNQTDAAAVMESSSWSYGALPQTFPGFAYATTTASPLVYFRL